MPPQLQPVFTQLRDILAKHATDFIVGRHTPEHYRLEAPVGPTTIEAWGGKTKTATIPVAWVEARKAYVSYHLMGCANPKLLENCSRQVLARMQGKTCFNFKSVDEKLLEEMEQLTTASLVGMRKAGYITGSATK
jgi:hypothetical protein